MAVLTTKNNVMDFTSVSTQHSDRKLLFCGIYDFELRVPTCFNYIYLILYGLSDGVETNSVTIKIQRKIL